MLVWCWSTLPPRARLSSWNRPRRPGRARESINEPIAPIAAIHRPRKHRPSPGYFRNRPPPSGGSRVACTRCGDRGMAAVLDGRRLHRWHAAVPELPESDQRSEPGVEHRLPRRRAATPPNPLGICSPERQIVAPRQPRSCNRARLARCQLAGARMHQCPRQQRVPITRCGSSPPPNRAEGRMHDPRPEQPALRSAAKRKEC